ncbi:hypothetical protein [Simplicispira suum]|nr:hypothetical protein [Simplicispira suum]
MSDASFGRHCSPAAQWADDAVRKGGERLPSAIVLAGERRNTDVASRI